ncbi:hypothetical protein HFK74_28375|nr:hypothetical protein [Pseudomonas sp. SbOxS1]NYU06622.1 hypothetical protein [Pseudomonas sp. SbOxS1]
MKRLSPIGLCVALSVFSAQGGAETVAPMKVQLEINECHSITASSTAA